MHSEHIERAISAASQGSRVAVYAETLELASALAARVEDAVTVELERVTRTNGRRRLDFYGGGSIRFLSLRGHSTRGLSLDRVFVPVTTTPDALAELIPTLMTSAEGVLTGY